VPIKRPLRDSNPACFAKWKERSSKSARRSYQMSEMSEMLIAGHSTVGWRTEERVVGFN
jgi:hypothetical protein